MRIVMISGILTDARVDWSEFRHEFKKHLPDASFHVEIEPMCALYEVKRFRRFLARLAKKYDTGEDVLLVGHSLGGVLACALQPMLKKTRVVGIATIHSPHRFFFGICTRIFGAGAVTAPIVSFQGLYDGLVWWGTRHPRAIRHVRNQSNHFNDLWEYPENAELIVGVIMESLLHKNKAAQ